MRSAVSKYSRHLYRDNIPLSFGSVWVSRTQIVPTVIETECQARQVISKCVEIEWGSTAPTLSGTDGSPSC